jgi:hypothetical protein
MWDSWRWSRYIYQSKTNSNLIFQECSKYDNLQYWIWSWCFNTSLNFLIWPQDESGLNVGWFLDMIPTVPLWMWCKSLHASLEFASASRHVAKNGHRLYGSPVIAECLCNLLECCTVKMFPVTVLPITGFWSAKEYRNCWLSTITIAGKGRSRVFL